MRLLGIRYEDTEWIYLAQDTDQWRMGLVFVSCSWQSMLVTKHCVQFFVLTTHGKRAMSTVPPQHLAKYKLPHVQDIEGDSV